MLYFVFWKSNHWKYKYICWVRALCLGQIALSDMVPEDFEDDGMSNVNDVTYGQKSPFVIISNSFMKNLYRV